MRKIITLFCCLVSATIFAGNEFVAAGRTSTPPVLDGKLDDACWQESIEIGNFIRLRTAGEVAKRRTQAYVTYDDKNLYVAFRCFEETVHPVLNQLHRFKANCHRDDDVSIWRDDLVELFIAPDPNNRERYFHIAANRNGKVYDTIGMGVPTTWSGAIRAAGNTFIVGGTAQDNRSGWNVELSIPFSSLGVKSPQAGSRFMVNFARSAQSIEETSSWTQVSGRFHDPGSFGTLELRNKVPRINDISNMAAVHNGRNYFDGAAGAPVRNDLTLDFGSSDSVIFSEVVSGKFKIPYTLDPANMAYRFTALSKDDGTETFLRSGTVSFRPNENYKIRARFKSKYTAERIGKDGYGFLTIVQKQKGYQMLPLFAPCDSKNEYVTSSGVFRNGPDVSGTLWGIKWAKRNLKGQATIDDVSVMEESTGRELFPNGDFSQGIKEWNIFRRENLVPGYGNGATQVKINYAFAAESGEKLYQSAVYQFKIGREYTAIAARMVQFGYDGIIPLDQLHIAANSVERVNLMLRSDRTDSLKDVHVELFVPEGVRLLPLTGRGPTSLHPRSATNVMTERNGKKGTLYTLTFGPEAVNALNAESTMQFGFPLYFMADTLKRGALGAIEYRARLNDKEVEPMRKMELAVLDPLPGRAPSHALPLILWVYSDTAETDQMSRAEFSAMRQKIADAGYNMTPGNINTVKEYKALGIRSFPMLPTLTIGGAYYFPNAYAFIKKHPEYGAVNAFGKCAGTVDPAVLLDKNNPFLSDMRKFFKRYLEVFPDEMHIDYEFGFMPRAKGQLPSGYAVIGFSKRNLELFKKQYKINEPALTPQIIFERYGKEWLEFRNQQVADTIALKVRIVREINPKVRFSIYSGYPPISADHYGIDWRKVGREVDLCMAGYGGDDALLLKSIPQKFFNSGLLLMSYVDPSGIANTYGGMLTNAGSFMGYVHYTVDGRYFANSAKASHIAADYENFFLKLKDSRQNDKTVDQSTGKTRGDVTTFVDGNRRMVFINNREGVPRAYKLRSAGGEKLKAVRHSDKKVFDCNDFSATVAPFGLEGFLLLPASELANVAPKTPGNLRISAGNYPVLRFTGVNGALERYEVRYRDKVHAVSKPFFQIPEDVAGKSISVAVRSVLPDGRASNWQSAEFAVEPARPFTADRRDETLSAAKFGFWQHYSWGGGSQLARFGISRDEKAGSDTGSLWISNEFDTTQSYWTAYRQGVVAGPVPKAEVGATYRLTAWIKGTGSTVGSISFECLDAHGKHVARVNSQSVSNRPWTLVTAVLKVPAGGVYFNMRFAGAGGPGKVFASDIKIEKVSAAK